MPRTPKPTNCGMILFAASSRTANVEYSADELIEEAARHAQYYGFRVGPRARRYQDAAIALLLKKGILSTLESGKYQWGPGGQEFFLSARTSLAERDHADANERYALTCAHFNEVMKPLSKRSRAALAKYAEHLERVLKGRPSQAGPSGAQTAGARSFCDAGVQRTPSPEPASRSPVSTGQHLAPSSSLAVAAHASSGAQRALSSEPTSPMSGASGSQTRPTRDIMPSTPVRNTRPEHAYPTPETNPRRRGRDAAENVRTPPSPADEEQSDEDEEMEVDRAVSEERESAADDPRVRAVLEVRAKWDRLVDELIAAVRTQSPEQAEAAGAGLRECYEDLRRCWARPREQDAQTDAPPSRERGLDAEIARLSEALRDATAQIGELERRHTATALAARAFLGQSDVFRECLDKNGALQLKSDVSQTAGGGPAGGAS